MAWKKPIEGNLCDPVLDVEDSFVQLSLDHDFVHLSEQGKWLKSLDEKFRNERDNK